MINEAFQECNARCQCTELHLRNTGLVRNEFFNLCLRLNKFFNICLRLCLCLESIYYDSRSAANSDGSGHAQSDDGFIPPRLHKRLLRHLEHLLRLHKRLQLGINVGEGFSLHKNARSMVQAACKQAARHPEVNPK
jgi:hypothetical protein